MHILSEADYHKITPFFSDIPINTLFAQMITQKKRRGTIFVDNPQKPAACLIVHPYGMLLLTGETGNTRFNDDVIEYILTNKAEKTYWLQVSPDPWHKIIGTLLGDALITYDEIKKNCAKDNKEPEPEANRLTRSRVIRWGRTDFKFNHERHSGYKKPEIPNGLTLRKVDKALYESIEGTVVPKYFWDSYADFKNNGMGLSLTKGNIVLATCFSAFKIGDNFEIGIETSAGHRQKGYAEIVAAAMIDYCLENNFEPVWGCRTENTGSYILAHKLGFEVAFQFPYYSLIKK
jgi:hypothetical protein